MGCGARSVPVYGKQGEGSGDVGWKDPADQLVRSVDQVMRASRQTEGWLSAVSPVLSQLVQDPEMRHGYESPCHRLGGQMAALEVNSASCLPQPC